MENNQYGFVNMQEHMQRGREYELFSHKTGGMTYLLALLFPQIIGGMILILIMNIFGENTDPYLFSAYAITQLTMLLAIMTAVNFKFKPTLDRIHFNKPQKTIDIPLMIPLAVVMVFGLNFIAGGFLLLLEKLGYVMQEVPFPNTTTAGGFTLGVIAICILPGIVEEIIFRGVILRSFSNKNHWKGIIISAALFSLMHGSAQQTAYQFVVGVILGLVAVKTNSIIPCMVLHALNNLVSITLQFFTEEAITTFSQYALLPALFICLAICAYYVKRETPQTIEVEERIKMMGSVQLKDGMGNPYGMSRDITCDVRFIQKQRKTQAKIFYACGIAFGLFTWITMTIMGF